MSQERCLEQPFDRICWGRAPWSMADCDSAAILSESEQMAGGRRDTLGGLGFVGAAQTASPTDANERWAPKEAPPRGPQQPVRRYAPPSPPKLTVYLGTGTITYVCRQGVGGRHGAGLSGSAGTGPPEGEPSTGTGDSAPVRTGLPFAPR